MPATITVSFTAVATVLTVYGIETDIVQQGTMWTVFGVATVLTVYGIETAATLSFYRPFLLLQQYLPFTVLKPYGNRKYGTIPEACCNSTYRLRY